MKKKQQLGFFDNSLVEAGSGNSHPENGQRGSAPASANHSNQAKADGSGNDHPENGKGYSQRLHFGLDWGDDDKCCANGVKCESMEEWIKNHPGVILCVEENFHSWCPERHNEIMDLATEHDVILKCVHTNALKNFRRDWEYEHKNEEPLGKSDETDSSLIYVMYEVRPGAFVPPRKLDNTSKTLNPADQELVLARRATSEDRETYGEQEVHVQYWEEHYVPLLSKHDSLMDYQSSPAKIKMDCWALETIKKSIALRLSTIAYILHAKNRKDFDNYWCARRHRGIGTSNLYYHQLKRERNYALRKRKMQAFRRVVRRLYKIVKRKQTELSFYSQGSQECEAPSGERSARIGKKVGINNKEKG
jgi:hypothetical protein